MLQFAINSLGVLEINDQSFNLNEKKIQFKYSFKKLYMIAPLK